MLGSLGLPPVPSGYEDLTRVRAYCVFSLLYKMGKSISPSSLGHVGRFVVPWVLMVEGKFKSTNSAIS